MSTFLHKTLDGPEQEMLGAAVNRRLSPRKISWKLAWVQCFFLMLVAFFCAVITHSTLVVKSVVGGGIATIVPNLYFILKFSTVSDVRSMMRSLYFAEIVKVLMTALLFVLMVRSYVFSVPFLLLGFFAAYLAYLTAPLWVYSDVLSMFRRVK